MNEFKKIKPLSNNFYNQTRKMLLRLIEEKDLDGFLITNPANIFYFTGFFYVTNERPSGFFLSKENKRILVEFKYHNLCILFFLYLITFNL